MVCLWHISSISVSPHIIGSLSAKARVLHATRGLDALTSCTAHTAYRTNSASSLSFVFPLLNSHFKHSAQPTVIHFQASMSSIAIKCLGSCEDGQKNSVSRLPMNPITLTTAVPAAHFPGVRAISSLDTCLLSPTYVAGVDVRDRLRRATVLLLPYSLHRTVMHVPESSEPFCTIPTVSPVVDAHTQVHVSATQNAVQNPSISEDPELGES